MSLIESILKVISPATALRRKVSEHKLDLFDKVRQYDGAGFGKGTKGWQALSSSANLENFQSIVTLRNRSRDLVRNNAFAKRAKQIVFTNIVGAGIRAKIKGTTPKEDKKVKDTWRKWAETTECDYDGKQTLYGMQSIVMGAVFESGECLARKRYVNDKNSLLPVKIQVVEADLLDHNRNYPYGTNLSETNPGGYIIQGIEFDKNGRLVAYWLFDRHPYDLVSTNITSHRVESSEIMHIYEIERPGQVRGVSSIAPVMLKVKHFDDYEYTELLRQKVAACYSVFITDEADDGTGSLTEGQIKNARDGQLQKLEPARIEYLPPGKSISFSAPPTTQNYDSYGRAIQRSIAAGMGVTYESMTGDYSNVNFSSGRMGWIESQRLNEHKQNNVMIPMFCNKSFDWFLQGCAIIGITTNKLIYAEWIPPRREMIDPVKETKSLSDLVRNGFKSWEMAVMELGDDPEILFAQLVKEDKLFRENELMLACDPTFDANRINEPLQEETDNKEDK